MLAADSAHRPEYQAIIDQQGEIVERLGFWLMPKNFTTDSMGDNPVELSSRDFS